MSEPKRLHPAAMILNFFAGLVETVKNYIIPFGVAFFLNKNHTVTIIASAAVGLIFIFLVASSIIKWRKFTYRIEEDELRVEEGLITKKKGTFRSSAFKRSTQAPASSSKFSGLSNSRSKRPEAEKKLRSSFRPFPRLKRKTSSRHSLRESRKSMLLKASRLILRKKAPGRLMKKSLWT